MLDWQFVYPTSVLNGTFILFASFLDHYLYLFYDAFTSFIKVTTDNLNLLILKFIFCPYDLETWGIKGRYINRM